MMRFLWTAQVTEKYTFLPCAETEDTRANRSWNKSNLAGRRRGRLAAEAPSEQRKGHDSVWRCFCDCGEIRAPLLRVRYGGRKSCGCLGYPPLKEFAGKRFGRLAAAGRTGKWAAFKMGGKGLL